MLTAAFGQLGVDIGAASVLPANLVWGTPNLVDGNHADRVDELCQSDDAGGEP